MQCAPSRWDCQKVQVYDKECNITSDTFGTGCCAVNFMYAMTKMRFKKKVKVTQEDSNNV